MAEEKENRAKSLGAGADERGEGAWNGIRDRGWGAGVEVEGRKAEEGE